MSVTRRVNCPRTSKASNPLQRHLATGVVSVMPPPPPFISGMRSPRRTSSASPSRKKAASRQCDDSSSAPHSNLAARARAALTPAGLELSAESPSPTAHAITDVALRKSEVLLAKMVALGLADHDEVGSAEDEHEDAVSTIAAMSESACSSPRSFPILPSTTSKTTDTVEVPAALLDLFVETWARHRNVQLDAEGVDRCRPYHDHVAEPKSKRITSQASSTTIDGLSSADDASCWSSAGCSVSVPSLAPASCSSSVASPRMSPRKTLGERQILGERHSLLESGPQDRRASCASLIQSPILGHRQILRQAAPAIAVESRAGCRPVSCTVQQTVTITHTVHFNY
jgi:hypothetical protein